MNGYVRCACCNLPIAVTADDIGLSVTCPRTRKLIPVKATDVRSATTAATKPPAKPAAPAPTRPAKPAAKTAKSTARSVPLPPPKLAAPRPTPEPPEATRSRRWPVVCAALLGVVVLAVAGTYAINNVAPGGSRTITLEVKPAASVNDGARRSFVVVATSTGAGSPKDAVRATVIAD